MKVCISYPPIPDGLGVPMVGQNRQFQWFSVPTYIYPMVPSYAATLLRQEGFKVIWDDAIAEELTYEQWLRRIEKVKPDLMMIETKTPVVKRHWRIINHLKELLPDTIVVLVGDHVTALPEESFRFSKVDYVLTGGDYDFLLLNLAKHIRGDPDAKVLEPGIWYRTKSGEIKTTGKFRLDHDLTELPFIDRDLTKWWLYAYKNGNFKRVPGTYTMVGRDCWWRKNGGCTFCAWTVLYPIFRVRKPEQLVEEIAYVVDKYGIKEVFDDTGTFPVGKWLRDFCKLMVEYGLSEKIYFSCNMRFGALRKEDYRVMKKAGFRMLLFGLESANQETLDRINKGIKVSDIIRECKWASEAGLEPHLTIMVGYPWETREQAWRTFALAKYLFDKGWAKTLQVTIVIPYPGTRLFYEALKNNWLKTLDWDEYDMTKPVMKTALPDEDIKTMCRIIYLLHASPSHVMQLVANVKTTDDIKYIIRGFFKVIGHVKDFLRNKRNNRKLVEIHSK